jgi:regulator of protease activity HflC (stomatin/prohibitin superfamily)
MYQVRVLVLLVAVAGAAGCVQINQGEVGVKRRWGKLEARVLPPGLAFYEPVSTDVIKVPTRTVKVRVAHTLPSREGLNIETEISILYRIDPAMAPRIIETIGSDYEDDLIVSVFRSSAADVSARFLAKDMYSAERTNIEREIAQAMGRVIGHRGFVIEAVLMKSIRLPPGLARSIESKLESEQAAQRMQFVLDQERAEAERKRVEAAGIRDAQKIIADGLTPEIIQWRTIDAFRNLASSPNTKILVTDGRTPLLVQPRD